MKKWISRPIPGAIVLSAVGALIVPSVIFVLLFLGVSRALKSDLGFQELNEAPKWAFLQGVEFDHRADRDRAMPKLLRRTASKEDYDALGLPTGDKNSPFVWIVLNDHRVAGGVFSMPDGKYTIDCSYVRHVEGEVKLDPVVDLDLMRHCR